MKNLHEPSDTEKKRALDVASLILDAYEDEQPIPEIKGIDAVNLANVLVEFSRLAARPETSGPAQPLAVNRRTPAAGEVLPPAQRASHWRDRVPGID